MVYRDDDNFNALLAEAIDDVDSAFSAAEALTEDC